MKRFIIAAVLCFGMIAASLRAESPLSSLGHGLFIGSAGTRSAGMGQVSLAVQDSLGLNLLAPSHWRSGNYTRFGFHGGFTGNKAEDSGGSVGSDDAGLTGFALAIPLGKDRFAGLSLSPLTRMDYRFKYLQSNAWTPTESLNRGSGGITQSLLAFSTPVRDDMRMGFALRGLFGTIDRTWETRFPGIRADSARWVSLENETRVTGVGWNLSWQWLSQMNWNFGAVISGPVDANVQNHKSVNAGGFVQEEFTIDQDEALQIPWSIAVGAGRKLGAHLTAAELSLNKWDGLDEPADIAGELLDAYRFSVGWEWSPEFRLLDPFWRSLTYRGGIYLQDSYIRTTLGHRPRKLALTAGLSLPYYYGNSRMDIALEVGWMGDRDLDLVAERTIGIAIGFNHREKWFVGRRERY